MTMLRTMLPTGGGAVCSDWQQYTPTYDTAGGGAIGNGTAVGLWRRVGDSVEVVVRVAFGSTSTYGTGAADPFRFSLPPGITRDAAKILSGGSTRVPGTAYLLDASTSANNLAGEMVSASGSTMTILPGGTSTQVCSTVPFTWTTSDVINISAVVPATEYNGGINLAASISPAALSGNVNDYNPTGLHTTNYVRLDAGAASRLVTGLQAPASGSTVLAIVNIGAANAIILKHQNTGSTAANRFISDTGGDVILLHGQQAKCWYDSTTARWRVSSYQDHVPAVWELVPGAARAWRADLGMSYSAGASMTWTDQIGSSTLSISTGSQVPVLNTADANLGNQASITFDGTDDNLVSNLAASAWNYLHDGTGASVLVVCRPTKTTNATNNLFATSAGAASRGVRLIHSATNDRFRLSISDGASFVIDINTGTGAAEPVSQAVYFDHLTTSTPDASLEAPPGTSIGTGSGTPSASAAALTLKVGDTSNAFGGEIAEIVIWARQLTSLEKQHLAAYTLARYGV